MTLEITDLSVSIDDKKIIEKANLKLEKGKVYAIMGPNGSGKSTLANAIMGNPKYKITSGKIKIDEKDITNTDTDERARLGLFMSFQNPVEIPGVTFSNLLKTAYNNIYPEKKLSVLEFHNMLKEKLKELKIDDKFLRRYVNTGFSGGEKKKAEILQLSVLNPKYAILDETDSGLDVDALKTICEWINKIRTKENTFIIITHYIKVLDYISPDQIFVVKNGKIIATGKKELAKKIEKDGFDSM